MTSQAPTGLEPWTPVRLRETSVTERAVFKRCRRRWLLSVVHRLGQPGVNANFWIGELVHAGLEAYYRHELEEGERRERSAPARTAALRAYNLRAEAAVAEVSEELGFLWDYAAEEWTGLVELGRAMLMGYFTYDQEQGGLGEVLHVEERWSVRIPGTRGRLRLRMDLVTRTTKGKVRGVDHKTAGSRPNDDLLDIDDQFSGYHWGYHAATGEWLDSVLRNVLLKRAPEPPRLINKGKALSRDKSQHTTLPLYLAALREHGFDRIEYEDMLSFLAAQAWEAFFARQETIRTKGQARQFELNLAMEWRDMARVAAHPTEAYPSPDALQCGSCPVRTICQAMMNEDDVEGLIRAHYVVKEERE